MAAWSLVFRSKGKPFGAATACHEYTLASLMPNSSKVGTLGNKGERFALVIDSARNLPAKICGMAVLTFMKEEST